MKSHTRAFVLVVLFAIVSLAPALQALTGTVAKVNVPFAFNCGAQHFAPGLYTLEFLNMHTMLLTNRKNSTFMMISPEFALHETKTGYATFRKFGNQYFLEEISIPGSTVHVSLNEWQWERHAARELAGQKIQPSRIQLALVSSLEPVTH